MDESLYSYSHLPITCNDIDVFANYDLVLFNLLFDIYFVFASQKLLLLLKRIKKNFTLYTLDGNSILIFFFFSFYRYEHRSEVSMNYLVSFLAWMRQKSSVNPKI